MIILTEDMFYEGLELEINDGKKTLLFKVNKVIPMRMFNHEIKRWNLSMTQKSY